jgi:hypothetical protein
VCVTVHDVKLHDRSDLWQKGLHPWSGQSAASDGDGGDCHIYIRKEKWQAVGEDEDGSYDADEISYIQFASLLYHNI